MSPEMLIDEAQQGCDDIEAAARVMLLGLVISAPPIDPTVRLDAEN